MSTPAVLAAPWRPSRGMFEPGRPTLDPRVFDLATGQMRADVRAGVLAALDAFLRPRYGDWTAWARVYLAGSGASHWWDSDVDLDILIGIDRDALVAARPQNAPYTEEQICAALDVPMKAEFDPAHTATWFAPDSGPWEFTAFFNPDSYDIRDLKPYAAYSLDDDAWVVRPPELPADWGWKYLPPETWRRFDQIAREAEAVLALPEPQRHQAVVALFDTLHRWRHQAYSEHGQGWLDTGNVIWQALGQHPDRLLQRLYAEKHADDLATTAATEWHRTAPTGVGGSYSYRSSFEGSNGTTYYLTLRSYYDAIECFVVDERGGKRVVGGLTTWERNGRREVLEVVVDPAHRRQGIATAMLALAREGYPDLVHSEVLSEDGKAWSQTVGAYLDAPGGTIYRGLRVPFTDSMKHHFREYLEIEETKERRAYKVGPEILDFMEQHGSRLSPHGLGVHWSERVEMAGVAAETSGVFGEIPVIIEAVYTPADVAPEGDEVYDLGSVWRGNKIEAEITIKPGARLTVTGVWLFVGSLNDQVTSVDDCPRRNVRGDTYANVLERPQQRTASLAVVASSPSSGYTHTGGSHDHGQAQDAQRDAGGSRAGARRTHGSPAGSVFDWRPLQPLYDPRPLARTPRGVERSRNFDEDLARVQRSNPGIANQVDLYLDALVHGLLPVGLLASKDPDRELDGTFTINVRDKRGRPTLWRVGLYVTTPEFHENWIVYWLGDHNYGEPVKQTRGSLKTSLPSWRDRGERPEADCLIAPDTGRSSRNSFEVFTYGAPVGRYPTLRAAKESVEAVYGPLPWRRVPGDRQPHFDPVWGPTTEFNDARYYLVVDHLPALGVTGSNVVDYKADRPLTGESARQISDLMSHVTAVPYDDVPFADALDEVMGTDREHDALQDYLDRREDFFRRQPITSVPLSTPFVVTQQAVNLPRVQQMIDHPETAGTEPIWMVLWRGQYYTINGHHRLVADYLRGAHSISARVVHPEALRAAAAAAWSVYQVPTALLAPYNDDVLAERPDGFLEDLRADIEAHGIREPIKPMGTSEQPITGIWDGKHRLWLAQQMGLATVPALLTPAMAQALGVEGKTATKDTWKQIPDLRFEVGDKSVNAWAGEQYAGVITWHPGGEIRWINVADPYRRQGLATELLRRAREVYPDVHHSDVRSDDGWEWSQHAASRDGSGYWDRSGDIPRWVQPHAELVEEALHSWKGWPSTMRLHMDSAGGPVPDSGSGKIMRAQAEALLHEMASNAKATTKPLYRGDSRTPGGWTAWSESKRVARGWARKGGGQVWVLPAGAWGLRVADYISSGADEIEKEWIIADPQGAQPERTASYTPWQPPPGIEVQTGGDSNYGQWDGWVAFFDSATGEKIGYLDYSLYQGEISIKMVEVEPKYQRQGYATLLLEAAKHDTPDAKVNPGYTTPEGGAWWHAVAPRLGARSKQEIYATEMQVRPAAAVINDPEAPNGNALLRRILTDAGFPQGSQAEIVVHPKGHGTSSVAWDTGTTPPIPLVALGGGMWDEMTLIHEAAHIIRNGPSYAGRQSEGMETHDDQWFDTYHRLLVRYAPPKVWRQFEFAFGLKPGSGRTARLAALETTDYEGAVGDPTHITRVQRGTVPTSAVAHLRGVNGEVPGEHRNKQGEVWDAFKADIRANGIREPIFITVDYGQEPKISEGNHRRDVAVEEHLSEVPVEIRYFGHAERTSTLSSIVASLEPVSASTATLWHVTDNPNFAIDPAYRARGGVGEDGPMPDDFRHSAGLFLTTNPELWHYLWRPMGPVFAAEIEVSGGVALRLGDSQGDDRDQWFVSANDLDKAHVKRVVPIKEAEREAKKQGYGFALLAKDAIDDRICVIDHTKGWGASEALCGGVTDGSPLQWTTVASLAANKSPYFREGRNACPECWQKIQRKAKRTAARTAARQELVEKRVTLEGTEFILVWDPFRPMAIREVIAYVESSLLQNQRFAQGSLAWYSDGQIANVAVERPYRRRGLATAMLEFARTIEPTIHHSHALTEDGKAWSQVVAKTASVTVTHSSPLPYDRYHVNERISIIEGSGYHPEADMDRARQRQEEAYQKWRANNPKRPRSDSYKPENVERWVASGYGYFTSENTLPGTVAFADLEVTDSTVYLAYMAVRPDQRRKGLARQVLEEIYRRHPGKTIDWGKMMAPEVGTLYDSFKQSHPEQTGHATPWY